MKLAARHLLTNEIRVTKAVSLSGKSHQCKSLQNWKLHKGFQPILGHA